MVMKCVILACAALVVALVEAKENKIPSYIHICKRNDPYVEDCILNSVEKLRPQLIKGIPELGAPPMDPLLIPEVVVAFGNNGGFSAVGHNVFVHGVSKFKVTKLKVEIEKNIFYVGLTLPELFFTADYDVNIKIGALPIKSRGPLQANATGISGDVVLKGDLVKKNGDVYLTFPEVEVDLQIKDIWVKIENLFRNDQVLTEAANTAINANSKEVIKSILPTIERTVGNVILNFANNVVKNFSYDELFPQE